MNFLLFTFTPFETKIHNELIALNFYKKRSAITKYYKFHPLIPLHSEINSYSYHYKDLTNISSLLTPNLIYCRHGLLLHRNSLPRTKDLVQIQSFQSRLPSVIV